MRGSRSAARQARGRAAGDLVRTSRTRIESCLLKPSATARAGRTDASGGGGGATVRHGAPFITATQSSGRRDFDDYRKQFVGRARGASARTRRDEERYLYNNYLGCIDPQQRSVFDTERREYFQRSIREQRETFSRQRARSASRQRIGRENMLSSVVHQRAFAQERQRRTFERIARAHHRPASAGARPAAAPAGDPALGDLQSLRDLDNFDLGRVVYAVVRPRSAYH